MPAEGVALTPSARLLSSVELVQLARVFVRAGVNKIRLTGGEPTLRADLVPIVAALKQMRPLGVLLRLHLSCSVFFLILELYSPVHVISCGLFKMA